MAEERILCAANWYDDGKQYNSSMGGKMPTGFVICGHRHDHCIKIFAKMVGFPYNEDAMMLKKTEVQGFLTSHGRFVGRKEAYKIAESQNQIGIGPCSEKIGLFSENIY